MLHYVTLGVSDIQRSGAFYDALLAPLAWRRQYESSSAIGWGLIRPVFYVITNETTHPGFGSVSFPAKSIPAVKAAWEAGVGHGGETESEPGAPPLLGTASYAARLRDPDGYSVEVAVAPD